MKFKIGQHVKISSKDLVFKDVKGTILSCITGEEFIAYDILIVDGKFKYIAKENEIELDESKHPIVFNMKRKHMDRMKQFFDQTSFTDVEELGLTKIGSAVFEAIFQDENYATLQLKDVEPFYWAPPVGPTMAESFKVFKIAKVLDKLFGWYTSNSVEPSI